jgi:hypothetical protein
MCVVRSHVQGKQIPFSKSADLRDRDSDMSALNSIDRYGRALELRLVLL